jgi:hypothetical protein
VSSIDRCMVMDCIYGCKNGKCLPKPSDNRCMTMLCPYGHQCVNGACVGQDVPSTCGDWICQAHEKQCVVGGVNMGNKTSITPAGCCAADCGTAYAP